MLTKQIVKSKAKYITELWIVSNLKVRLIECYHQIKGEFPKISLFSRKNHRFKVFYI